MPLTPTAIAATVDTIAAVQLADGMIPWFGGGHADPWNHVEAAMALTAGGRTAEAHRAFEWLVANQRPDGAWHQYYLAGAQVEIALLDANVTAYVATGVWHHYLATGDAGFLAALWPTVERAMGFVLALQAPGGEILWARHADGRPWSFALLTASSSTALSLRSAAAGAARLGHDPTPWDTAAARLDEAIAERPGSFLPKDRWSMDWYYPVLAGVLDGDRAAERLDRDAGRFVMDGLGVRCVADRPWVTAAETCEAAMAYAAAGRADDARRLFGWAQHLRAADGSYFTGMVHPERVHFPGGERTTYSAAAVVLAADVLAGGPAARLFGARQGAARPH